MQIAKIENNECICPVFMVLRDIVLYTTDVFQLPALIDK